MRNAHPSCIFRSTLTNRINLAKWYICTIGFFGREYHIKEYKFSRGVCEYAVCVQWETTQALPKQKTKRSIPDLGQRDSTHSIIPTWGRDSLGSDLTPELLLQKDSLAGA